MPDRDSGDLGLEAYSFDGSAYQCYAAEEPLGTDECYAKQRDKLTRDLGKLKTYESELAAMLGNVVVRRYVFMVHRHDSKRLNTHAATKASEVISWGLGFVGADFHIVVETDDDYAGERSELLSIPTALVECDKIEDSDRLKWSSENSDLRETVVAKLNKVLPSPGSVDGLVDRLTKQYLLGENVVEKIRSVSPEVHRGILAYRDQYEDLLALEYPPGLADGRTTIANIARDFEGVLNREFPLIGSSQAKTIAWSAVAGWLMRCPLDFEAAS